MKKIEKKIKKRFLMPLCMMLISGTAFAEINITISWQDDAKMSVSVQAEHSENGYYWARLTADAPLDELHIECVDEDYPGKIYTPSNGSVLQNVVLVTDVDPLCGQIINGFNNGQWTDSLMLYLSMLELPVSAEEAATETVYVPVYCQTTDGVFLGSTTAECKSGMPNHVSPPILEGYTAVKDQQVDVTVYTDGNYTPADIWFDYLVGMSVPVAEPTAAAGRTRPPETAATPAPTTTPVITVQVPVSCRDGNGNIVSIGTVECSSVEENKVVPQEIEGWLSVSAQPVSVTVNADGTVSPVEVIFVYEEVPMPVFDVNVSVSYQLADGRELGSMIYTFQSDEKGSVSAPSFTGYHIQGENPVAVEADENGKPIPESIVFVYEPDPKAVVTIRHVDESGQNIIEPEKAEIIAGCSAVIEPGETPEGWVVFHAVPVMITASAEGVPDVEEVCFIYRVAEEDIRPAVGEYVNRFGQTNNSQVAVRKQPSDKASLAMERISRGTMLWVIDRQIDEKGKEWSHILVHGSEGYMRSEFIDEMTRLESDIYEYEHGMKMPRYPIE